MELDASTLSGRDAYALMIACIVPRPVAWVSTASRDGGRNLAPFSYFMGVGSKPPMLAVSVGRRKNGPKDTSRNIRETGEFVVNLCPARLAEKMVATSGEFDASVDEFEVAGLAPAPSRVVAAPGVAESPVRMECRLHQIVEPAPGVDLVIGEVLHFHLDDDVLTDGRPDPAKLNPIARLGGRTYASLGAYFELDRPSSGG